MHDSSLENMNVSIPRTLAGFVQRRVKQRFGNRSEYIRHLIREDEKQAGQERLEQLLLEGLDSGKPSTANRKFWDDLKAEARRRLAGAKKPQRKTPKAGR